MCGGPTVVNQPASVPEMSAEEKALLQKQVDWANYTYPNATRLQDLAMDNINNQQVYPNPNWQTMYNQAQAQTANNQNQVNSLIGVAPYSAYQSNNQLNNYGTQYQNALTQSNNANNQYANQYANASNNYQNTFGNIQNGLLPSQYAQNRQAALMDDLQGTVGNTINSLAGRGVVNSSIANSAFNNIEKNAANTLASQYSNDIAQAANLANTGYANTLSGIGKQADLSSQNYANAIANLGSQSGLTNQQFNNILQGLSSQSQLLNQAQQFAVDPIQTAALAQNASIDVPKQYFAMATGQNAPTSSLLTQMSNQRYSMASPAQTYVTQGNGGLLGGLMQGAGAYFGAACFGAGTLICTPNGDVPIEQVSVGDKVYSLDDNNNVCIETVTDVMEPQFSDDDYLVIDSLTVTTSTQSFITSDGEVFAPDIAGKTVLCVDGERLINTVSPADKEVVFDLATTGRNIYFADGMAVKGR